MTEVMRVALVGPLPPPFGGMANQTRQLARLLQLEGIEVGIVQTNAPYRPRAIENIRVLRAAFRLLPFLGSLWREVRRSGVVHVMANSGTAWYLLAAPAIHMAVALRKPVIVNYRGGLAREFLKSAPTWVLPTLRKATAVVVPSAFLETVFREHGIRTTIIPNVVDAATFHPAPAAVANRYHCHLVVARNLEPIYGIDLALRALKILKDCGIPVRLSVAGVGPEKENLTALVSELGIAGEVQFLGRLDVEAMACLYRTADLVVNPSRVDNTPNSILEALATGIPVVSTSVGGIPDLVQHAETAWLVSPESAKDLAAGIRTLLESPEICNRLSWNGALLANQCSWPQVKERWLMAYRQAITASRAVQDSSSA